MNATEVAGLFSGVAKAIQDFTRVAWSLVWWDGFAHGLLAGGLLVLIVFVISLYREPR